MLKGAIYGSTNSLLVCSRYLLVSFSLPLLQSFTHCVIVKTLWWQRIIINNSKSCELLHVDLCYLNELGGYYFTRE